MQSVNLLFIGRPGSGKSTAIHHILAWAKEQDLATEAMRDYDILYSMFQSDMREGIQSRFKPTAFGGFDVQNFSVLDEALEQLQTQVEELPKPEKPRMVTIELARNDYSKELKFSSEFLKKCYILFIEADLQICIERIQQRVQQRKHSDQHYVSEHIMNTYYSHNNSDFMESPESKELLHCKDIFTYYNTDSPEKLEDKAITFVRDILTREVSQQKVLVR